MEITAKEKSRKTGRWRALVSIERLLDPVMVVLGFIWVVVIIVEMTASTAALRTTATIIWIVFIFDLLFRLAIAPNRLIFLRHNWLTVFAILVPAVRIFRVLRLLRAVRLIRLITSIARGLKSLSYTLRQRGFAYVLAAVVIVTFAGAAGMYVFEQDQPRGFDSYSSALWWTAMVVLTIGSDSWPTSPEGRVLCLFVALFGFSVLGYLTATVAAFFLGQRPTENAALLKDIRSLRAELRDARRPST